MHVPSTVMQGQDQFTNFRYTDLTWFLSERVDLRSTNGVKAVGLSSTSHKFIPKDGNTVCYQFQNNQFSIWHKTEEVLISDKICTKHEICVSGRKTTP